MSSQPSQPSGAGESGDGSGSSRGHQAMQKLKQGARLVRKKSRDSFSGFGQRLKGGARRIFGRQHHEDDAPPVPSVPTLATPSDLGPETVPSIQEPSMPPGQPPTSKASVQFQLPHDTTATAPSVSPVPDSTARRHLSAATFATTSSERSSEAPSSDVGVNPLQPPPRPSAGEQLAPSRLSVGFSPSTVAGPSNLDPRARVSAFGIDASTAQELKSAGERPKSPAISEEQSNE